MADESPRVSSCVHCGCSCASKTSQGGEGSKRPASLLDAPTDDDVPSDERARRLARRTLDALHPKAVDKLEPEFGVVKLENVNCSRLRSAARCAAWLPDLRGRE